MTSRHITLRAPASLIEALDDKAAARECSRSDVIKLALEAFISEPVTHLPVTQQAVTHQEPPPVTHPPVSLLDQACNCPDETESIRLALEIIGELAHDAAQRGLLMGAPQELGMAVWAACSQRQDLELLTDYLSKLHGALRAV